MRKLLLITAISTPLGVLLLMYVHFSTSGKLPTLIEHYLFSIVAMNAFGFIAFGVDKWLDFRISWKDFFLTRLLCGLVANMIIIVPLAIALTVNFTKAFQPDSVKIGVLLIISLFIYEIAYGWFYSFRYYAHTQVERLRLERWQLELQFESLKNQISPHFLFNCLNTISSLIYKDASLTEEFIRRMADTFRYVLKNHKQRFVFLHEEIEFVKAYQYLLRVRFEDNFRLDVNLSKEILNTPVPPLTLQLLVENAVKHNHVTKNNPLTVKISSQANHLIVMNNKGEENKNNTDGFSIGLENIRKRYAFFTQEPVEISNADEFSVRLPLLPKNLHA